MKYRILFSLLLLVVLKKVNGQIEVSSVTRPTEQKEVEKPEPYDSFYNFLDIKNDYQQIGLEIFFPKWNKKKFSKRTSQSEWMSRYIFSKDSSDLILDNKKYIVLKIIKNNYTGLKDDIRDNLFSSNYLLSYENNDSDNFNIYKSTNLIQEKIYLLKSLATGDSIYYATSKENPWDDWDYSSYKQATQFILVPYFEKLKNIYDGKFMTNIKGDIVRRDFYTNKKITIQKNSEWKCSVKVLDVDYHQGIFFLFSNNENTIACRDEYRREYDNEIYDLKNGRLNDINSYPDEGYCDFKLSNIVKEEQRKAKLQQSILLSEQKREERQRLLSQQNAIKIHLDICVSNYGEELGKIIASGRVRIGMTKEMCKTAWGEPYNTNKTIQASGTTEIWWYYGLEKFLTFSNGVLVRINE